MPDICTWSSVALSTRPSQEQVTGSDKQRMVAAGILLLLVLAAFVAANTVVLVPDATIAAADYGIVSNFTAGKFRHPKSWFEAVNQPRDEIDQLRNACNYMAMHDSAAVGQLARKRPVATRTGDQHLPRSAYATGNDAGLYRDTDYQRRIARSPDTTCNIWQFARKHAAHLGNLIQDLFELALLDSSRVSHPSSRSSLLTELIHDVVQEFELRADR